MQYSKTGGIGKRERRSLKTLFEVRTVIHHKITKKKKALLKYIKIKIGIK